MHISRMVFETIVSRTNSTSVPGQRRTPKGVLNNTENKYSTDSSDNFIGTALTSVENDNNNHDDQVREHHSTSRLPLVSRKRDQRSSNCNAYERNLTSTTRVHG